MLRIIFFGTPSFAVPFLEALAHDAAFEIAAVVSQPDKPSGRGNEVKPTATKTAATKLGIPVLQPASLRKDPTIVDQLRSLNTDVFVVVAYGKLIPTSVLELPRLGCVNVHPSLLPRHRGPSPMQAAIAEGDAESGVTIMKLDEGMDTGPMLASGSWQFPPEADQPSAGAVGETYKTLEEKVHAIGVPLLLETLKAYAAGTIKPVPQSTEGVTVTHLLEREDGKADWSFSAAVLDARRRAYGSWPGLWTTWKGARLKLIETSTASSPFQGEVKEGLPLPPGKVRVSGDALEIGTADGVLRVTKLQPEDSKPMSAAAFINGHPDIDGAQFA